MVRLAWPPYSLGMNLERAAMWAGIGGYLVLALAPCAAADFGKGLDAYQQGDYGRALAEWMPLAAAGDRNAMYNVALIYEQGLGRPADREEALRWYRLPAEEGDVAARFSMALLYDADSGGRDREAALYWYRAAAELADEEAQYILGRAYLSGDGVAADIAAALYWFRLSADQGHVGARFRLGRIFDRAEGVAEDNAAALRWYRLAAEQGDARALHAVGAMFGSGEAGVCDPLEAYKWFYIAERLGNDESRRSRLTSERALTAADIRAAREQAIAWLDRYAASR